MSVLTRSTTPDAPRDRYRFTVDEYHQMIRTGFFRHEDRVELLEGELVMMPPIGPEHVASSDSLRERIGRLLPDSLSLRVASPITIPPHSEPEPDLCIVKRRSDYYSSSHPQPLDVFLVIEVSDSSARFDASEKAALYGRAGIPEYWVLDITAKVLRVFTKPSSQGYEEQRTLQSHETILCGSVPQLELPVAAMLL